MLMHSCYCIFISVTGGFVQMLKDFKNLLKMSLKILFIKRKRKFLSIPSLPQFRPAGLSFRGPAPAPAGSPPLFPARPSYARPSNYRRRAPSPRAQPLTPGPHLSAPPPTSRVPRPLPVKAEPPFSALASWERPPRAPRPR